MREYYPFYMTYGSPLLLQGDTIEEQEFDRLKGDYPEAARQVQALVERECSLLDYEGSWLYDEHPDKWSVYRLSRKIRRQMEGLQSSGVQGERQSGVDLSKLSMIETSSGVREQQSAGQDSAALPENCRKYDFKEPQETGGQTAGLTAAGGDFLEELIEVLLFHEISRRRCRRRRYFYPGGRF